MNKFMRIIKDKSYWKGVLISGLIIFALAPLINMFQGGGKLSVEYFLWLFPVSFGGTTILSYPLKILGDDD